MYPVVRGRWTEVEEVISPFVVVDDVVSLKHRHSNSDSSIRRNTDEIIPGISVNVTCETFKNNVNITLPKGIYI